MVVTRNDYEPQNELTMLEGYYFNSLSHPEKVSAIVNSIGLKLKRTTKDISVLSGETSNHFLNNIKWSITKKEFNKKVRILTVELLRNDDPKIL